MRLAAYSVDGVHFWGAVEDEGMVALSPEFPGYPTLAEVIAWGALGALEDKAAALPIPDPAPVTKAMRPSAPMSRSLSGLSVKYQLRWRP